MQPVQREIVEWDEYIGRLESPETVEVRARVSGYLDKVHFKEGNEVKKGDLLFTIDRRPYQAEFDRAEAEYQRASSQTELAKNDADRAKRLIGTKAISEEDYDTKLKTYIAGQATEKSAKATMESARLNLEFTEIHSPINGRISRAVVTQGNLISSGIAIRSYSYMEQSPMQEIDIHEGIESTLTMLGHKLKNVTVVRAFDRSVPRIMAYGSELNQVWTNLIDNAIHAVNGAGKICIGTSLEDNQLVIEIVDNGSGIPANVQPHLFEPFFTTKHVGTGLGLVISNRIVGDRHGGEIEFEPLC
jgi:signal transduction histidine kinase